MIKLKAFLDSQLGKLSKRWKELPLKKQRVYTLVFLLGYTVLTMGVILKVGHDVGKPGHSVAIEHIQNPTIRKIGPALSMQDSMKIILKNKIHERNSK